MSKLHYGRCEKCGFMGGLNDSLVCICCVDEKKLLTKTIKERNSFLEEQVGDLTKCSNEKFVCIESDMVDVLYCSGCNNKNELQLRKK